NRNVRVLSPEIERIGVRKNLIHHVGRHETPVFSSSELLAHKPFVTDRIVDRNRGFRCNGIEQVEIILAEYLQLILTVHVDYSEHAGFTQQGRAHYRADTLQYDRPRLNEPVVLLSIE